MKTMIPSLIITIFLAGCVVPFTDLDTDDSDTSTGTNINTDTGTGTYSSDSTVDTGTGTLIDTGTGTLIDTGTGNSTEDNCKSFDHCLELYPHHDVKACNPNTSLCRCPDSTGELKLCRDVDPIADADSDTGALTEDNCTSVEQCKTLYPYHDVKACNPNTLLCRCPDINTGDLGLCRDVDPIDTDPDTTDTGVDTDTTDTGVDTDTTDTGIDTDTTDTGVDTDTEDHCTDIDQCKLLYPSLSVAACNSTTVCRCYGYKDSDTGTDPDHKEACSLLL
jgi:hypothetical protein